MAHSWSRARTPGKSRRNFSPEAAIVEANPRKQVAAERDADAGGDQNCAGQRDRSQAGRKESAMP